jgi:hypothetical protein
MAPVLALLGKGDFASARACGASFAALWSNHREFMQERDALFVGYGEAGVTARFQAVRFPAFERWMRLTGAATEIAALDEFAAHCRYRRDHPRAPIAGEIVDFGSPLERDLQAAGVQIVPVRSDLFAEWRRAFAQLGLFETAPALSDYAALVIEACIESSGRRRFA